MLSFQRRYRRCDIAMVYKDPIRIGNFFPYNRRDINIDRHYPHDLGTNLHRYRCSYKDSVYMHQFPRNANRQNHCNIGTHILPIKIYERTHKINVFNIHEEGLFCNYIKNPYHGFVGITHAFSRTVSSFTTIVRFHCNLQSDTLVLPEWRDDFKERISNNEELRSGSKFCWSTYRSAN